MVHALALLLLSSAPAGAADSVPADPAGGAAFHPPQLRGTVTPAWPEDAAAGASGIVELLVTVGTDGSVRDVRVLEGPEVFRSSARDAAFKLVFTPGEQEGAPIESAVQVRFEYRERPADAPDFGPEALVVEAAPRDSAGPQARSTLEADEIERSSGDGLAETIATVPGVTLAGGTADAAKPIIRGLQERRLLVLLDGVRHESQKWGPDHATEVDPTFAGQITVVRGAAGAQYGPDAIGGVILVEPARLRDTPGFEGKAQSSFSSNGLRAFGGARVDVVPAAVRGLTVRAEANYGRGAALSAPRYTLGNTGSEVWNAGGTVALRVGAVELRGDFHHHDLRAGVFYGVRNSTIDEFEANLDAEVPVTASLWAPTYTIDRPYQAVEHDVATLHLVTPIGHESALSAIYAFQVNRRSEFEQVRSSIDGAQYDFTLRTHSLDATWHQPARSVLGGSLQGGLGIQGLFQENVYRGLPLIPNFRALGGGAFLFQRVSVARATLELALRHDLLGRDAYFEPSELDRHLRRGTLDASSCVPAGEVARCDARYGASSATLGGRVALVPDRLEIAAELSSASRFPNVDELYLIGTAPTYPVYALGTPDLPVERSWGGSATMGLDLPWLHAEASVFGSYIENFVYFAPERGENGALHYDVTIRGTWPTYSFRPINAWLYGADGRFQVGPAARVGLDARASIVREQEQKSGAHLVGTPPDRLNLTLVLRAPPWRWFRDTTGSVGTQLVARQALVDPREDFAPAPDGYALLDASIDTSLHLRGREVRIGVAATNLLDTPYREYTSLLRYYADQPGRDVRVRAAVDI